MANGKGASGGGGTALKRVTTAGRVDEALTTLGMTRRDVLEVTGLATAPNATHEITAFGANSLAIRSTVDNDPILGTVRANRVITRNPDGTKILENSSFSASGGEGRVGLRMNLDQVRVAQRVGISRIETTGAGSGTGISISRNGTIKANRLQAGLFIGFRVWPQNGFSNPSTPRGRTSFRGRRARLIERGLTAVNEGRRAGRISPEGARLARARISALGNARNLRELVSTPVGRQVWGGLGSTVNLTFNTSPRSRNVRALVKEANRQGISARGVRTR